MTSPRAQRRLILAVLAALLTAGVLAAPASASGSLTAVPSHLAALEAEARAQGSVRVVVGFDAAARPEAALAPTEVVEQRGRIRAARDGLRRELQSAAVTDVRELDTVPYVAMEVTPAGLAELRRSGAVTSITEDVELRPALTSAVSLTGADQLVGAGLDGTGKVVAVLDTGVDRSHPFLADKVVAEACFSAGKGCPNGSTSQIGTGAARPCTYDPGCAHGTHVAGIVAGSSSTVKGVAPGARVLAVQVFSPTKEGDPEKSTAYFSDVLKALEHVYGLRSSIDLAAVNLSISGGRHVDTCDNVYPALTSIVGTLRAAGIATVVASGNEGHTDSTGLPACLSQVVSVGSSTGSLTGESISFFTNTAPHLTLLAPGQGVSSAVPGGGFARMSGTSMAAPHVAGAIAALKQRSPDATVTSLVSELRRNGVPLSGAGGTFPRIALAASITTASPSPAPPACPSTVTAVARFTDVTLANAHFANVNCVAWWGVVNGVTAHAFGPTLSLTRAQAASLLARTIDESGTPLPPGPDRFTDIAGSAHRDNIHRLAHAGLLGGVTATTFAPDRRVTRAQMATLIVNAHEHLTGASLPAGPDAFGDDDGNVHEASINKAAAAGLVSGIAPGSYAPERHVQRDQVASLIARLLIRMVEHGHMAPPTV